MEAGPTGLAAGEIAAAVGASPAKLTFHLKELAHAGLVASRQAGRYVFYSANFERMNEVLAFLTENCCAHLPPVPGTGKRKSKAKRARA